MYDVSIVPCPDYSDEAAEKALVSVLEPLGGLEWVKSGMKIVIKANLVSFMKPDSAAVTHPALLAALTRLLVRRGASVVIGDSPGGLYTGVYVNRVYAAAGTRAAEKAGAALNQDFTVKKAEYPESKVLKTFDYTGYLDDCDAIINFCKLKSHGMMTMSAAAKNMFGAVPGTVKLEYHYRFPQTPDFAEMIIDLDEYFKPVISIADAVVAMEGNGPTQGSPRPMGALLASKSPHKLDLACARLMGLEARQVPTLAAALGRGMIPESADSLKVCGDLAAFAAADFKNILHVSSSQEFGTAENLFGKVGSAFLRKVLGTRPKLSPPAACVGCGECARICPAKAITMKNKKPVIDRGKCIRCFCCQEFCPKGAMKTHRPLIAKILSKH